jgi:hypothetical protein
MYINGSPAGFYSDLKCDNILLSTSPDGFEHIVLIDFEQRANWTTFSPPEIYYLEYLLKLTRSPQVPQVSKDRYIKMLKYHMPFMNGTARPVQGEIYSDPEGGYNMIWNSLSETRQEAAEVYSLGKVLWCIFEGCGDTSNSVAKEFEHDTGQEFPEFIRTPPRIRELILWCTKGSPDRTAKEKVGIIRVGAKVFPRDINCLIGETEEMVSVTIAAAKTMWQNIVRNMEIYLEAEQKWGTGDGSDQDIELLGFVHGPRLIDVLRSLVEVEHELNSSNI